MSQYTVLFDANVFYLSILTQQGLVATVADFEQFADLL